MPTICPVAIAIGCRRCPIFTVCPAKSLIGDQAPAAPAPIAKAAARARASSKPGKPRKAAAKKARRSRSR